MVSTNFNGFYNPIGGFSRLVTPTIAVQNCPFNRFGIALGARTTAIRLSDQSSVAVYSPIPYGPESEKLLDLLQTRNVKYLIAPDIEHHIGLDSWKKQFPSATVIGVSPLAKKRQNNSKYLANLDVQFSSAMANQVRTDPLPEQLAAEFQAVYINAHRNKELVLFHTPTSTMITADLFINTPCYEQYKGSGMSPTGGFSYITNFLGIESQMLKSGIQLLLRKDKAMPGLKAISESWNMDRIIMCHGEIIEHNANDKFDKFFFHSHDPSPS